MAKVQNLFRAAKRRLPMEELREVRLLVDFGLESCAHGRPGGRQVLLVDRESLEAMGLQPGILRENITTDGLNVNALPVGQHLRIGEARLEVSAVCTPCDLMERIRPGLRKELMPEGIGVSGVSGYGLILGRRVGASGGRFLSS